MLTTSCKTCGKNFFVKPSHLKRGWGKYCSSKCQYEAQKRGKFVYCEVCRKRVWRTPLQLKRSTNKKFFCSKSHHMSWKNKELQVGENHPNWTGGEFAGRGILERSDREMICINCGISDRRVLMVHHKDSNRKNNKVENLIWLCQNCHHLIHYYNMET